MKRFLLLLPLLLVVGCGSNAEKEMSCTLSSNDIINNYKLNSTYKVFYKKDTVIKVDTIETVESDSKEILDYFEEFVDESYSKMNEVYGGYVYNVDRTDTKVVSTVTIDYSKMDLNTFVKDQPNLKSYVNKDNKLIVDGLKSLYESMGANCTKK